MKVNDKNYLTITEMAEELGITYTAVKTRLFRAGIKATSFEALFEPSALEAIRNVPGKGRPKKAPEPPKSSLKKAKKKTRTEE